jgi:diamine N-acetyltransferase
MTDLRLEELSADTALQANSLELRPGQEQFITPITYENADASIDHTNTWSRVVVMGDDVVGFIRAHFDPHNPHEELRCCVWRVNVSAAAQGQGVGRFAIDAVRHEAKAREFHTLTVAWQPGDAGPGEFFHHLGFIDTGVTEYGDVVGSLSLD